MAAAGSQRQELYAAKLRALVSSQRPSGPGVELSFPDGAALLFPDGLWVLDQASGGRSLGAALAVASVRLGPDAELDLIAADRAGDLARKASRFRSPVRVWAVEGRGVTLVRPEPLQRATERPDPDWFSTLARQIASAGAEPVFEGGTLRAEVLGLEVARVDLRSGVPALSVGVGRHDRLAHQLVDTGSEPFADLASAVRQVRRHRRPGVPSHPANQLARERWLRSVLVAQPRLAGASELRPVSTASLPQELGAFSPAAALGTDSDGASVLVVATVGVDPEVVVGGADAREDLGAEKLVFAVPQSDRMRFGTLVSSRLRRTAEWRPVPSDWRDAAGKEASDDSQGRLGSPR